MSLNPLRLKLAALASASLALLAACGGGGGIGSSGTGAAPTTDREAGMARLAALKAAMVRHTKPQ